jgi:hypothetical protein
MHLTAKMKHHNAIICIFNGGLRAYEFGIWITRKFSDACWLGEMLIHDEQLCTRFGGRAVRIDIIGDLVGHTGFQEEFSPIA